MSHKQLAQELNHVTTEIAATERQLVERSRVFNSLKNRVEDVTKKPLNDSEKAQYSTLSVALSALMERKETLKEHKNMLEASLKAVEQQLPVAKLTESKKGTKRQAVFQVEIEGRKRSFTCHLVLTNGKWLGLHPLTGRAFEFAI